MNAFAAIERDVKRWCLSEQELFLKTQVCHWKRLSDYLLMVDNHPTTQNGEGVRGGFNVHKFSMSISIHVWRNNLHKCIVLIADITTTAVDWYNFVRDICAEYFQQHPMTIGGPGIEVEINESKKAIGCLEGWRGLQGEHSWWKLPREMLQHSSLLFSSISGL